MINLKNSFGFRDGTPCFENLLQIGRRALKYPLSPSRDTSSSRRRMSLARLRAVWLRG